MIDKLSANGTDRSNERCTGPTFSCSNVLIRLITFFLIIAILFFVVSPSPGKAAGLTTVTPKLSVQEQYDDNVDLEPNNKESDWISLISPGLTFVYKTQSTTIDLDYEGGFAYYLNDSSRDTTRHAGNLKLGYQFAQLWLIDLQDNFTRTDDPIFVTQEGNVQIQQGRETQYRNTASIRVWGGRGGGTGHENQLQMIYTNRYLDSKSPTTSDSMVHEGFIDLDYWPAPAKFALFTQFLLNRTTFQESTEDQFYRYEAELLLNYRLIPTTMDDRIYLKYRIQYQDFDESKDDDFWVHLVSIGSGYKISPLTSWRAEVGYTRQDYKNGDDVNSFVLDANFSTAGKKATFSASISSGIAQEFATSENRGSTKYAGGSTSVGYQLMENLRVFADGRYQWSESFGETGRENRKDHDWNARAGLALNLWRWLRLTLGGEHFRRESTDPTEEFTDNRVTLRIEGAYPIGLGHDEKP